jgi:hypothetical protein
MAQDAVVDRDLGLAAEAFLDVIGGSLVDLSVAGGELRDHLGDCTAVAGAHPDDLS